MDGSLDSTTMTALAVVLTAVAALLTFVAYRRRGLAAGVKGLAWTLVPAAALLTGTLRLVVGFADDISRWAARLVFSPVVWTGVALAGVAVVLWVVGGMLSARGIGVTARPARKGVAPAAPAAAGVAAADRPAKKRSKQPAPQSDEGMDEIEAILKKHGI